VKSLLQRYSEAVFDGFETILNQIDPIRKAGAMLAEAKIAGGRWVLYDRGYAMSLDTSTRGSNPFDNRMYRMNTNEFEDGDCLVLGSYCADDPEDIAVVKELRKKNNTRLITISPHKKPENPRTETLLHTLADRAIDNGTDNRGGAFDVRGIMGGILPCARDINLTINQAIVAEYIQNMVESGRSPSQFYMVHFPYFKEIQEVMNKRVEKLGY